MFAECLFRKKQLFRTGRCICPDHIETVSPGSEYVKCPYRTPAKQSKCNEYMEPKENLVAPWLRKGE